MTFLQSGPVHHVSAAPPHSKELLPAASGGQRARWGRRRSGDLGSAYSNWAALIATRPRPKTHAPCNCIRTVLSLRSQSRSGTQTNVSRPQPLPVFTEDERRHRGCHKPWPRRVVTSARAHNALSQRGPPGAQARAAGRSKLTCKAELDGHFRVEKGGAAVEEAHDRVQREDGLQQRHGGSPRRWSGP